jgi:hypothetical protein
MKYLPSVKSTLFTALATFISYFGYTQEKAIDSLRLYFPGPANQDTSKYAMIYVTRSESDPNPDYWGEIYIDRFPMAKIVSDAKYIIYCAKQGETEIRCGDEYSINVNMSPGEKIYVSMTLNGTKKMIVPKLERLDQGNGEKKFTSSTLSTIRIYDPDPMEYTFHGEKIQSWYTRDELKKDRLQ